MANFLSSCWNVIVSFVGKLKASLNATNNDVDCLPWARPWATATPELSTPLPEELVERIMSMLPFPQIFKARSLSKSWRAKLSSISSQDDKEKKLLAMSFQKQVCEHSHKWNTFRPVYLFSPDFIMAYDSASKKWRKIPILPVIPDREDITVKAHLLAHLSGSCRGFCSIVGALLFIESILNMLVVNIFTGSWKELPIIPHGIRRNGTRMRPVSSKEMYKVIRLHIDGDCVCACVYDPRLGAWTSKSVEVLGIQQGFTLGWYDVYLNGVLYVIVSVSETVWGFLAFNVQDETFNLLQMPSTDMMSIRITLSLQLVACNGTVYLVVHDNFGVVGLLEVDFVSRRWSKVIQGPSDPTRFDIFWEHVFTDGDCLFFQRDARNARRNEKDLLAYNVRKDEWSSTALERIVDQCSLQGDPSSSYVVPDLVRCFFQPGINPFLEV